MVQISHSGANEEKIIEILVAAQKRFGLYGFAKTAMHEIAGDLGISKASLYYYYPDKESLFLAVFEKEKQEFINQLYQTIEKSDDPVYLLHAFVDLRMKNFRSFVNLGRASLSEIQGIKSIVRDSWKHFIEKEKDAIRYIFDKGIKKGIFTIQHKDETAALFIDALRGLSYIGLKTGDIMQLNDENIMNMEKKIKLFTSVFIKGISK
jgi:AcrR family transcriptional regulator